MPANNASAIYRGACHWRPDINYREQPEGYHVGKGEQGVFICQPYKSEIGPFWRFRTKSVALKSAQKIYRLFLDYLYHGDFPGADMARKYLQMGFTRSRRYTNYKGGNKYTKEARPKGSGDSEKAASAQVFYERWQAAEANETYARQKEQWKQERG